MRSSWKPALVKWVGVLTYLGGLLLFLAVAVDAFLSPPAQSLANLSTAHVVTLVLGLALVVVGQVIAWKFGGSALIHGPTTPLPNRGPDQSRLEELGYQLPPEDDDRGDADVAFEDGTAYVVCGECNARNERGFGRCRNCSAKLPE